MGAPVADIEQVRQGTRRILLTVGDLTDEQAAARSRLPGWTRAEVLTHLARNADSQRHVLEAAVRGEPAERYPGGPQQRTGDIEAGAGRPAAALVDDVRRTIWQLEGAWPAVPAEGWELVGTSLGRPEPVAELPFFRWREVEVHHVDLGLGYAPSEWPVGFVTRGLDDALREMPGRATQSAPANAAVRLEATDHDRAWIVHTGNDGAARVVADVDGMASVDATVTGWGCDLLAWLYGRDPTGGALTASGDIAALHLPEWFPYP